MSTDLSAKIRVQMYVCETINTLEPDLWSPTVSDTSKSEYICIRIWTQYTCTRNIVQPNIQQAHAHHLKLATFSMLYGMPKSIHEKAIDMCDPTINTNIDFNHLLYYPETEKKFDASLLIVIISANLHVTPLC